MGKVWVLDTETKGTGANMVPLEKVLQRPDARREHEPIFVPPKPRPRPVEAPAPKRPPRFKVVDVRVSRWDDDADHWRPLSLAQQRAIWQLRDR